jgi:hypothetical protein
MIEIISYIVIFILFIIFSYRDYKIHLRQQTFTLLNSAFHKEGKDITGCNCNVCVNSARLISKLQRNKRYGRIGGGGIGHSF